MLTASYNRDKKDKIMIYNLIDKNDNYIELSEGDNKLIVPSSAVIVVDDESELNTIKSISSRKNIASYKQNNE